MYLHCVFFSEILVPIICITKNNLQHKNLFNKIHISYENFFFIIYTFTIKPQNNFYDMIINNKLKADLNQHYFPNYLTIHFQNLEVFSIEQYIPKILRNCLFFSNDTYYKMKLLIKNTICGNYKTLPDIMSADK